MTWLSQLVSRGSNDQRRIIHDDRRRVIEKGKAHRRVMSVEGLEHRMVLSNVSALFSSSGVLTITGDPYNDSFSITETAGGQVRLASTSPRTTIDLTRVPYTTPSKVSSIVVILPGTVNIDNVTLVGPGKTTATTVNSVSITATGANLTFTANGLDNHGSLTVSDTAGLTGGNDAAFHASVDNSMFASISITQTGNFLAYVELSNDNTIAGLVSGPVTVSEGVANTDQIILDKLAGESDVFGSTVLTQGAGPAFSGASGTADSVSVSHAQVTDLTIKQRLNGNGDSIAVNTVGLALSSFGVVTSQGNGNGDTTTITEVTAPSPSNASTVGPKGPPSILVTQGYGNGDSATTTNSKLPGNITLVQGDGNGDSASIAHVTVGFTLTGRRQDQELLRELDYRAGHREG